MMKKVYALIMAVMMVLFCGLTAAASVDGAIINTGEKGSITVYKYDETQAREEQMFQDSYVSVGEKNSDVENLYADYAIKGVEFTYLKLADISTCSIVDEQTGKESVQLVYGLNQTTLTTFSSLGLQTSDAVRVDTEGGIYYFTSDVLRGCLAEANRTMPVTTKNTLERFVKENPGTKMEKTDETGKSVANELELGLYLLVETAVPENVTMTTAPFFVSVPMTSVDGKHWVYDITVYPKSLTGKPEIRKEVSEVTSAPVRGEYSTAISASMGDEVAYRITSILPLITSEATHLTRYTFVDILEAGISYVPGQISLTWYDENGNELARWSELNQYFAVDYRGNQMTLEMTEAGLLQINPENSDESRGFSGCTLVIDYLATVDCSEEAVLGDAGNGNRVTLEWRRSSMEHADTLIAGENDSSRVNSGKAPAVYTYGIELTKLFSDGNGDATQVQFVVFNETDGYYLTAQEAARGQYYVTGKVGTSQGEATVFYPDSDGTLRIYGLESDIYRVKELETDSGYTLLKEDIRIYIQNERTEQVCAAQECNHETHEFLTAHATVNDDLVAMKSHGDSQNAIVPLTVINERGYEVPATGDRGTFFLPLVGMVGACGLMGIPVMVKKQRG